MRSTKFYFRFQSYPNTIEEEHSNRGWAPGVLADRAGVSIGSIVNFEIWAAGGVPYCEDMKTISDTTGQLIADTLGVKPEELFDQYAAAAAEFTPRVKPFATKAERDAAILAALEPVNYTAVKMSGTLRNNTVWYAIADIIEEAYKELGIVAAEAFTRGRSTVATF